MFKCDAYLCQVPATEWVLIELFTQDPDLPKPEVWHYCAKHFKSAQRNFDSGGAGDSIDWIADGSAA